ncbi:MAG TPA: DUF1800 domain-containing protein [Xanthobacteraceae bacterium]|jgi:hypothetical protein|nr:DUF1800 domain-containing protein [Xanthobacteraceae bacterium]
MAEVSQQSATLANAGAPGANRRNGGPEQWANDLTPVGAADWSFDFAGHLLERAGFSGTPDEIARLAGMTPEAAVASLTEYRAIANDHLAPFERSDVWDPSLRDFPVSRVAATELAEKTGQAMGVRIKPSGERRLQPVVDRFFYWLRATVLETRRLAYWWADRMVATNRPLEEKMALFWHGHFATGEEKIRDYRKMEQQLALFHRRATGNFRDLLRDVARDPAMLAYLDAAQNVKGAPNENFAREVMELFTMGVGNYSERDIREAARAFTGWIDDDLAFKVDVAKHDDGQKTFLGRSGNFDGLDILDIILDQKITAEFIAGKIYRFFVREELPLGLQAQLGALLRDNNYEVTPLLRTLFLSRDFYSAPSFGTHIKGPTEFVVSTYRKLGVKRLPGIPDLYTVSRELGQILLNPPTVAGWAQGRSWITPGLLLARGNLARDIMFPDIINFTDPNFSPGREVKRVNDRILAGMDIRVATLEDGPAEGGGMGGMEGGGEKTMANVIASAEDFNTRYGSLVGWQEAVRRVKPIPRAAAQFDLAKMVMAAGAKTSADAVDHLLLRLLRVPVDGQVRRTLTEFLDRQLGTSDLGQAATYLERPLRLVAHLIMSSPQFQLG